MESQYLKDGTGNPCTGHIMLETSPDRGDTTGADRLDTLGPDPLIGSIVGNMLKLTYRLEMETLVLDNVSFLVN